MFRVSHAGPDRTPNQKGKRRRQPGHAHPGGVLGHGGTEVWYDDRIENVERSRKETVEYGERDGASPRVHGRPREADDACAGEGNQPGDHDPRRALYDVGTEESAKEGGAGEDHEQVDRFGRGEAEGSLREEGEEEYGAEVAEVAEEAAHAQGEERDVCPGAAVHQASSCSSLSVRDDDSATEQEGCTEHEGSER